MRVVLRIIPFGAPGSSTDALDYSEALELGRRLDWPDEWPVPTRGDAVHVQHDRIDTLYVRDVSWYPQGDEDGGRPFVYVVLGGRP